MDYLQGVFFWFFILCFLSSLYILGIGPLSEGYLAKILSIVSLAVQRPYSLMRSHFLGKWNPIQKALS